MPNPRNPPPGMDDAESGQERELERQPDDLLDEFRLEVSDLPRPAPRWFARLAGSPPRNAGDTRPVPWYRQHVQVPRPVVVAAFAVLVVLVPLAASSVGSALGTLSSRLKPTPTIARAVVPTLLPSTPTLPPYPTPTLIAPAIGPVPANCPQGSLLVDFDPTAIIPGIGGPDVWFVAGAFVGAHGPAPRPRATLAIGSLRPSDYTSLGWPIQVMVLTKFGFIQPITLAGDDLHTGYKLWLSSDANHPDAVDEAAPIVTVDLSQLQSSTGDRNWHIWFGVLYLPGSGCYTLRASWSTGGWAVNFAAGR